MARNEIIMAEDIPINIGANFISSKPSASTHHNVVKTLDKTVEDIEKEKIMDALKRCGYVQARAARQASVLLRDR